MSIGINVFHSEQTRSVKRHSHVIKSYQLTFAFYFPDIIVANAVIVLKMLVQANIQRQQNIPSAVYSPISIISRLAYRIDEIHNPKARACIVWLVGQYAADESSSAENGKSQGGPEGIAPWAPDILRKTASSFLQEVLILSTSYDPR